MTTITTELLQAWEDTLRQTWREIDDAVDWLAAPDDLVQFNLRSANAYALHATSAIVAAKLAAAEEEDDGKDAL